MSADSTPRHDEQFCVTCGAIIKEQATLCPECGADNDGTASGPSDFHYCEACGVQIHSNPELCPECGVRQPSSTSGSFDGANVMLWVLGGLIILWGLSELIPPGASILTGLVVLLVGSITLPPVHQRIGQFSHRHSITTFGNVKSVEQYPVSRHDGTCASCDGPVEAGVRREYAEEFVLFGIVLSTQKSGSNVYCKSCELIQEQGASGHIDADTVPSNQLDETGTTEVPVESTAADQTERASTDQMESNAVENGEE
jgi:RNA polymerase subunit RPABC4/transcription elongation factor Spt4